jgi:SAM-dependent methyltransferase
LGDWFTFGSGVADGERFPSVSASDLIVDITVVNGGQPGYGVLMDAEAPLRPGRILPMSVYGTLRKVWRRSPAFVQHRLNDSETVRRAKRWLRDSMAKHDDLYDPEYYEMVDSAALSSVGPIADSIVGEFAPTTVLDVGCGTGALLAALRERGVRGTGLEYSRAGLAHCRARGLDVRQFDLETGHTPPIAARYDVVVSTEVAEHLPERLADPLVELIARHAPTIVFTAAPPGQGGLDHVNEQPHEYWISKFGQHGFRYDELASLRWRAEWKARRIAWFYPPNLMLFRRSELPR